MNIFSGNSTRRDFGKGLMTLLTGLKGSSFEDSSEPDFDLIYTTDTSWKGVSGIVGNKKNDIARALLRCYHYDRGPEGGLDSYLKNIARLLTLRRNTTPELIQRVITSESFIREIMEDEYLDAMGFFTDGGEWVKSPTEIGSELDNIAEDILQDLRMDESVWEEKTAKSVIEKIVPRIVGLTTNHSGYSVTGVNTKIPSLHLQHYQKYLVGSTIPNGCYQVSNSYMKRDNPVGISGGTITEAFLSNSD